MRRETRLAEELLALVSNFIVSAFARNTDRNLHPIQAQCQPKTLEPFAHAADAGYFQHGP